MANSVYDPSAGLACYVCWAKGKRIIHVPDSPVSYYCETCLMDAVHGGTLVLFAGEATECNNCGVELDPGERYCATCATHDDCHDECYRSCNECGRDYVTHVLCGSCMEEHDEYVRRDYEPECGECGSELTCAECNDLVKAGGTAVAAQPAMTTTDGQVFSDDEAVIDWGHIQA